MTATETQPAAPAVEPEPDPFAVAARAVDEATDALDDLAPEARDAAVALKDAVEAFHRPALVEIVQALKADPRGKELLFELVDVPAVRAVFALQGIIKADPTTRAMQALESVRPYLQSHGGDVELLDVTGSVATVRLLGSCNGCSMSAVTLRDGVTEALVERVPEIETVEVAEDQPSEAFIPLASVGRRTAEQKGWVPGPKVVDVEPGQMLRFDATVDGIDESVVVTNVKNRFAAFRNACVHQGLSLDGGMLDDGLVVCPWHGFRFDASTGECVTAPGAQLEQIPLRIDDGTIWLRVRS